MNPKPEAVEGAIVRLRDAVANQMAVGERGIFVAQADDLDDILDALSAAQARVGELERELELEPWGQERGTPWPGTPPTARRLAECIGEMATNDRAGLEQRVGFLIRRDRVTIREKWQARAEAAEAKVAELTADNEALRTVGAAMVSGYEAQLATLQDVGGGEQPNHALAACIFTFRDYERQHLAKTPPDVAKAERNAAAAKMCEDALAASPPVQAPQPEARREGERDYTAKSFADLRKVIGWIDADFPNDGDFSLALPAGHWRAILAAIPHAAKPKGSALPIAAQAHQPGGWRPIGDGTGPDDAPRDGTIFVGCNAEQPLFGSWPMYRRVRFVFVKDHVEMEDLGGWTILRNLEADYEQGDPSGPEPQCSIAPDALNKSVRYAWQPLPPGPQPVEAQGEG